MTIDSLLKLGFVSESIDVDSYENPSAGVSLMVTQSFDLMCDEVFSKPGNADDLLKTICIKIEKYVKKNDCELQDAVENYESDLEKWQKDTFKKIKSCKKTADGESLPDWLKENKISDDDLMAYLEDYIRTTLEGFI